MSEKSTDPKEKDTINDRRNDDYAFTSERDLIAFFSRSLPKNVIRKVIKDYHKQFILRNHNDIPDNKLQFLKKCEVELVRLTQEQLGIAGDSELLPPPKKNYFIPGKQLS